MQRNERGVQRYSSFITVTRLRIDASSHGETANGAAASAKSELVTYAYYVRTFKYYPPAIYHGQDLGRGDRYVDRCGLRLKARVQNERLK